MALKEKIKQNPALETSCTPFYYASGKNTSQLVDTYILFPLPKTWKRLCDLP